MTDKKKSKIVKDDDVMITSRISDLEILLAGVEEKTNSKFERFFLPALAVFSSIIIGMFIVIYSITQDMARLADAMDPNMGGNMSSMVKSVDSMSKSVSDMSGSVGSMQENMNEVNKNMTTVAKKMDNLDSISQNLNIVSTQLNTLEPMLINMEEMNKNMTVMQDQMNYMRSDIGVLRHSIARPLSIFNRMPIPF